MKALSSIPDHNQVWVCVVPQEEAVTRIMDRDGRSKEEAQRRVASQLSNAGERKTINRELIHLTFKCRKGFAGEHCALHSLAARGDPEAG